MQNQQCKSLLEKFKNLFAAILKNSYIMLDLQFKIYVLRCNSPIERRCLQEFLAVIAFLGTEIEAAALSAT